jgi:hypothetical protein
MYWYRFLGLSRPEGSFFSFASSVQVLVFVWLAICGINLPQFIYSGTEMTTTTNGLMTIVKCVILQHMPPRSSMIYWLIGRVLVFYWLIGRVLVFLVPLIITWVSYTGIYWKMIHIRSKVF